MKNEMNKGMNMGEIKDKLTEMVTTYNKSTNPEEKVRIQLQSKELTDQFNELAKLALYAEALNAEIPVAFLVKAHHYAVIATKFAPASDIDKETGKLVTAMVGSIDADRVKKVDLFDFIVWAEKSNRKVVADGAWKTILAQQQTRINKEFKKAVSNEANYTVSKKTANDVLQICFDAIIMVPGESGKNSVFPNKDCKNLIVSCAAEYKETVKDDNDVDITLDFFKTKKWYSTIQSCLYMILKNKAITYTYGDPEEAINSASVKVSGDKGAKPEKK